MELIEKRHTAANVKALLSKRLSHFGFKNSQLLSFSVDNASNMKAMVTAFNQEAYHEIVENEEAMHRSNVVFVECNDTNNNILLSIDPTLEDIIRLIGEHEQTEDDNDLDAILDDDDDDYHFNSIMTNMETNYAPSTMNVHRIPCACHTLQLAVKEFLETPEIKTLVTLCRTVAKILHRPTYKYELTEVNIKIRAIRLDCAVRWNSIRRMVNICL